MPAKSEPLKGSFRGPQKPASGRSQQQLPLQQRVDKDAAGGGGDGSVKQKYGKQDEVGRAEEEKKEIEVEVTPAVERSVGRSVGRSVAYCWLKE